MYLLGIQCLTQPSKDVKLRIDYVIHFAVDIYTTSEHRALVGKFNRLVTLCLPQISSQDVEPLADSHACVGVSRRTTRIHSSDACAREWCEMVAVSYPRVSGSRFCLLECDVFFLYPREQNVFFLATSARCDESTHERDCSS